MALGFYERPADGQRMRERETERRDRERERERVGKGKKPHRLAAQQNACCGGENCLTRAARVRVKGRDKKVEGQLGSRQASVF